MLGFWWTLAMVGIVFLTILTLVAYTVLAERRVAAWMQDRLGPNRVGPWGLFQPIADGIKLFLKEDIIPRHVDKVLYFLAPNIIMVAALVTFCVVPFGYAIKGVEMVIAPQVDVGMIYIFAVGSLAAYGVLLGGWASNNKYSFLGGMRAAAQMVSYEVPLGMSVVGIVLMCGSLRLEDIIGQQASQGWNFYIQPVAFLVFLVSIFAEGNRLPFDLPEAEQELVGGYHTEYSSMKFGLFFFAEYAHMITASFLISILFFGGWHFPWIAPKVADPTSISVLQGIVYILVLVAKVLFFLFVFIWVRWTIPRFRFDQLLALAWKGLLPLAMLNVLVVLTGVWLGFDWWAHTMAGVAMIITSVVFASWMAKSPEPGEAALAEPTV